MVPREVRAPAENIGKDGQGWLHASCLLFFLQSSFFLSPLTFFYPIFLPSLSNFFLISDFSMFLPFILQAPFYLYHFSFTTSLFISLSSPPLSFSLLLPSSSSCHSIFFLSPAISLIVLLTFLLLPQYLPPENL